MHQAKLSFACALALSGASLFMTGCASSPEDNTVGWSPNKIYSEAKDELGSGGYDKAIILFEKLEGRAAGTPLAQQAQIDKAYAQYKSGDTAQALATLERFMRLHPASSAMDYALYLKGIINFNDDLGLFSRISRQDLAERDQKASKESFDAFKELVARYPSSRYAQDASQRMTYIVSSLAQYEVHVARYYYLRGAYLAAINRAQLALTDYQGMPAIEEALFIMVKSYDALGLVQLRDDTKRILDKNYPQSEFTSRGFKTNSDPWWKVW